MTLVERLRLEGEDAMRKHLSLGMWKLCSEAADEIELLGRLAMGLNTKLVLAESRLTSIVHTAGGEIDGAPTSTVNILQRVRQLRDFADAHPGTWEHWRVGEENRAPQVGDGAWCEKCGCGNDVLGYGHLPSCPVAHSTTGRQPE